MKRRDFLKAGVVGIAGFSVAGLITNQPARAATHLDVQINARLSTKALINQSNIAVWEFASIDGTTGPGVLPSGLVVNSGDSVAVTITNQLDVDINFVVPGILEAADSPVCAAGATVTYQFVANQPGTYIYGDTLNGELGRAMGLMGPLVVMPAGGTNQLYANGPTFDRQYVLFMHELDSRVNNAVELGQAADMAAYQPNFFFLNGLSYPDTTLDPETFISCNLNENVAVRFINAGLIYAPMHFHGYHVDVIARDRVTQNPVMSKDTVLVGPGECVDVMMNVNQVGKYPLHSHYLPATTANGVYATASNAALGIAGAGGALAIIEAV
jgi:FtsP/CotA-like multicopper oxidase with cupredoxin domain